MGMFWRGEHTFAELHALGGTVGLYPPVKKTYFVDKEGGSDSQTGLGSWRNAKATYQAGVTAATCADNRYRDVDLIIAPAEYDEQVVVSPLQQNADDSWYGYRYGRLRIIHMGKAVILKNSTLDSSDTLRIQRSKTEIYGGTFRNYTDSGDFAAVRFERDNTITLPTPNVLNGGMWGSKIEGRTNQIGIDIDGAQYIWIEKCVIASHGDTGILIAGNAMGAPVEIVVKECYFRGNVNDILLGAAQFALLQDNIHADDGTTLFVGPSDYSGRTATNSDCLCVGARLNTTSINSGKFPSTTGIAVVDTHTHDR